MARSTVRTVNHRRMAADPQLASVMLRMMMAINDGALANTALSDWRAVTDRRRAWRAQGARMYFSRMQLGHALEALEIIKEIRDVPYLKKAVEACDERTRSSFAILENFIETNDHKLLLRIRNNLSFHYDDKLTRRALARAIERDPDGSSTFSLGTEPLQWHFDLADKIVDSIMVRDLIGVPPGQNAQPSTDDALARLWEIQAIFADFAGYFTRHHAT